MSASMLIRGLSSIANRSQISGFNIHSGMATCGPLETLTIRIEDSVFLK
jgi:hypothetical protein